jgi:hypothetical protein
MPSSTTDQFGQYKLWLAAGSADIDVYQTDVIWAPQLADQFVDLTDAAKDVIAQHFPSIVESQTVNGKLVAAYPGGHGDDTNGMVAFPITLAADTVYNYQYYMSEGGGGHGWHARWVTPGNPDPSNNGANRGAYSTAPLIPMSTNAAGSPGFTVDTEDVPEAPTLPAGGQAAVYTDVSASSVKINFVDNAASEVRYVLERS